MIECYEKDVIAKDGAVLHSCFRLVRQQSSCDVFDMRYETTSNRPFLYPQGLFVGLSEARYQEIKDGNGFPLRIARIWIGSTGEWNIERSEHYGRHHNLPINKCLDILGYQTGITINLKFQTSHPRLSVKDV